ncbi:DUF3514 domain-containing protein [Ehrlichia chaffeensis]|uniref:DUF3514 domain-containing protein n=1 Tax=Ehrlichia chaffeensis TaxID=945 RepID=UPI000444E769|nr:DUF3514 domain-containing protein [Ehrlichia chaffeensis]AHX07839.1 hypothetical protein ECHOSC_0976 [Ehrlichia chaffeensis str. Osceola]
MLFSIVAVVTAAAIAVVMMMSGDEIKKAASKSSGKKGRAKSSKTSSQVQKSLEPVTSAGEQAPTVQQEEIVQLPSDSQFESSSQDIVQTEEQVVKKKEDVKSGDQSQKKAVKKKLVLRDFYSGFKGSSEKVQVDITGGPITGQPTMLSYAERARIGISSKEKGKAVGQPITLSCSEKASSSVKGKKGPHAVSQEGYVVQKGDPGSKYLGEEVKPKVSGIQPIKVKEESKSSSISESVVKLSDQPSRKSLKKLVLGDSKAGSVPGVLKSPIEGDTVARPSLSYAEKVRIGISSKEKEAAVSQPTELICSEKASSGVKEKKSPHTVSQEGSQEGYVVQKEDLESKYLREGAKPKVSGIQPLKVQEEIKSSSISESVVKPSDQPSRKPIKKIVLEDTKTGSVPGVLKSPTEGDTVARPSLSYAEKVRIGISSKEKEAAVSQPTELICSEKANSGVKEKKSPHTVSQEGSQEGYVAQKEDLESKYLREGAKPKVSGMQPLKVKEEIKSSSISESVVKPSDQPSRKPLVKKLGLEASRKGSVPGMLKSPTEGDTVARPSLSYAEKVRIGISSKEKEAAVARSAVLSYAEKGKVGISSEKKQSKDPDDVIVLSTSGKSVNDDLQPVPQVLIPVQVVPAQHIVSRPVIYKHLSYGSKAGYSLAIQQFREEKIWDFAKMHMAYVYDSLDYMFFVKNGKLLLKPEIRDLLLKITNNIDLCTFLMKMVVLDHLMSRLCKFYVSDSLKYCASHFRNPSLVDNLLIQILSKKRIDCITMSQELRYNLAMCTKGYDANVFELHDSIFYSEVLSLYCEFMHASVDDEQSKTLCSLVELSCALQFGQMYHVLGKSKHMVVEGMNIEKMEKDLSEGKDVKQFIFRARIFGGYCYAMRKALRHMYIPTDKNTACAVAGLNVPSRMLKVCSKDIAEIIDDHVKRNKMDFSVFVNNMVSSVKRFMVSRHTRFLVREDISIYQAKISSKYKTIGPDSQVCSL